MKNISLVFALVVGCSGEDAIDTFAPDGGHYIEIDGSSQTLDCRPVRIEGCFNAFNDRACFHVPAGCDQ